MTDFVIRVITDPSGAVAGNRRVREELDKTEKRADGVGRAIGRAFGALASGAVLKSIQSYGDAFTSLFNSVRIANGGVGDLVGTTNELLSVANRARAPIEGISALYQRASIAAGELGANQQKLIKFTQAVAFGIGSQAGPAGAASGALFQLSQALGSGIVRAEEFNSILEGAFPIALAAAKGIDRAGGSVSKLRSLIVKGEVTSREFFDAILSQGEELAKVFNTTTPTIAQAFTVLNNGLVSAARNLQGVTGLAARTISDVGLAIGSLSGLSLELFPDEDRRRIEATRQVLLDLGNAAVAVGTFLAVNLAAQGIGAVIRGLGLLAIAIRTNPIGLLATAIVAAGSAMVGFGRDVRIAQDSTTTFGDLVGGAFEVARRNVVNFGESAIHVLTGFQTELDDISFQQLLQGTARFADAFVGFINAAMVAATNSFQNFFADFLRGLGRIGNFVTQSDRFRTDFANTGMTAGEAFSAAFEESVRNGPAQTFLAEVLEEGAVLAAKRAAKAFAVGGTGERFAAPGGPTAAPRATPVAGLSDRNAIVQQSLRDLQEEQSLIRAVGDEREALSAILRAEEKIRSELRQQNKGLSEEQLSQLSRLSEAERDRITELVKANSELERQAEILRSIKGPVQDYAQTFTSLSNLLKEGAISQRQFNLELGSSELATSLRSIDEEIFGNFSLGLEAQREALRLAEAEKLEIVNQALEARIITEEAANVRIRAINAQTAEQLKAINAAAYLEVVKLAENSFSSLADATKRFAGEDSAAYRALFGIQQGFALATAIVNTQAAITQALASSPPPGNFIKAALVGAEGAARIATITATTLGFANGGFVSGRGSSKSDSINANLSNGEFVVNARATRDNRATLEAMNRGGQPSRLNNVNVTFNVSTPDLDGFARSEGQIAARISRTLQRAASRDL